MRSDRIHTEKASRPLASGALSLSAVFVTGLLLLGSALLASLALTFEFFFYLSLYLVMTLLYSLCLKKIPIVDVFCLSSFYTLRLLMGVALAGVPISAWLLSFSTFFFLSLSLAKRYVEISMTDLPARELVAGRGYMGIDAPWVLALGISTSVAAILIIIQYVISSAFASKIYSIPLLLWMVPVIVSLWVLRVWMLAVREELDNDPVVFALKDKASLLLGVMLLTCFILTRFM